MTKCPELSRFFSISAQYNTVTVEKNKIADFVQKAVHSTADWNKQMNTERREKRKAYFDMQTFSIHYPMNGRGRMRVAKRPKLGHYPIALIPGQFVDYYRELTPAQMRHLPLNTALKGNGIMHVFHVIHLHNKIFLFFCPVLLLH